MPPLRGPAPKELEGDPPVAYASSLRVVKQPPAPTGLGTRWPLAAGAGIPPASMHRAALRPSPANRGVNKAQRWLRADQQARAGVPAEAPRVLGVGEEGIRRGQSRAAAGMGFGLAHLGIRWAEGGDDCHLY